MKDIALRLLFAAGGAVSASLLLGGSLAGSIWIAVAAVVGITLGVEIRKRKERS